MKRKRGKQKKRTFDTLDATTYLQRAPKRPRRKTKRFSLSLASHTHPIRSLNQLNSLTNISHHITPHHTTLHHTTHHTHSTSRSPRPKANHTSQTPTSTPSPDLTKPKRKNGHCVKQTNSQPSLTLATRIYGWMNGWMNE